ncbi:hypothetical protein [Luteimonas salinilitoris]|uniref:hypothetical protein n=1 Tax=Luteimonas salinilitoris TaxID=3237697 RepID=UPI00351C7D45
MLPDDVVAASHAAELAHHTLPLLGHAIHDGADAVRELLVASNRDGVKSVDPLLRKKCLENVSGAVSDLVPSIYPPAGFKEIVPDTFA